MAFLRAERILVTSAALFVFSRVFGLSLVLADFRPHFTSLSTPVLIGLAFSAHGITMALMQFPNGLLSDRIGRKPILVSASALFVGGSLLCAFSDSYALLLAGRLTQGLGAVGSVAVAAVGESVDPARRTMAMTLVGIPAGTGFFFGIMAGPALYDVWSMQGLFLVTAAIGIVPLLLLPFVTFAPPKPSSWQDPLPKESLALFGVGFALNFAMTTTLFHLGRIDWRILSPTMFVALIILATGSRFVDKRGLTWQPIAPLLIGVVAAAPLFALGSTWVFVGMGIMFFSCHGILSSVVPSQVSRIAGARGGRGHGIQNVIAYGGTAAAGPIAGLLLDAPWLNFAIVAALGVAAALGLLAFHRAPTPKSTPA